MSDAYFAPKWLHIVSSTVLFGTGIGTAVSMWAAHRDRDPQVLRAVTRNVVLADWLFTTPAVIVQRATGLALMLLIGYPLGTPWLVVSFALYLLVGACWLPVVGLQLRMRQLARESAASGQLLPPACERAYRQWFWLGGPAYVSALLIFALMVWKPALWG